MCYSPLVVAPETLNQYRIVEKLGEGGMGEVYRARDTKLGREVAIKVLPEAVARDQERLARFEREAKLLAALNHRGIATLFGFEESQGQPFLVMELVEGETLAERIARGPISLPEAMRLFRQIAEALDSAHLQGIVHRDLKPANVKITPRDEIKLLDFGLAKALEPEMTGSDLSLSPTIERNETRDGMILGTAPYMSPEQARGRSVDKRTDVWSFGCCLYEAITGERTFGRETLSDTLSAVLRDEPDWSALPASMRSLVRHCLEKDPFRRLRDIGDAIPRLQETDEAPTERAPSRRSWLPWAIAALAVAFAVARSLLTPGAEPRPVTRSTIALPPGQHLVASFADSFALSPDGTRLVYGAATDTGTSLYLRALDSFESVPIEGTSGAAGHFISPDGQSVGFLAEGGLRRVPLSGGVPTTISELPSQIVEPHGTWSPRGEIVLSLNPASGLTRVDVATGRTEGLTVLDAATSERGHRRPQVLPNGNDVLFTIELESGFRPAVVSLETGERREIEGLGPTGVEVQYVRSGHLVYEQSGALFAVKVDLEKLATKGSPVQVVSNVRVSLATEYADVAVSDDGTLAYLSGNADARLVWVDRSGAATPVLEEKDSFRFPSLSPEGRRVAVSTRTGPGLDLWVYELDRGTRTRLTTDGRRNVHPEWTPDGKRITFVSNRSGPPALFETAADGSGRAKALVPGEYPRIAPRWSADGKRLVFIELNPVTSFDIQIFENDVVTPWLAGPGSRGIPYFSLDGRVLSYTSNESGRIEVYAQPYPGPGERVIVSRDGGMEARWSRNGREIYYRNGDRMYAVSVETKPVLRVGAPQLLFEGRFESTPGGYPNYDVAADGRFLMIQSDTEELTQIHIVTNWFEELKAIDGR